MAPGDIDSTTGALTPGGDIPRTETFVSMARTLGGALGIPQTELDTSFVAGSGGKAVAAAVTALT